ncbi:right-handed parallel beta-helix repeat-containing protein [Rhodoferax sp. AJA081-3]|uniref:right-handed parallel beta-helix repeat-containing protein n=1 Tax=Rhodoferax sp. AJA081-3 TaxID=2752316 RepID=UPI001ADFD636|nr:right-handed parallel beta-helix repeat-containing protein [Rhodoferax sp. AJA081-3]QTN29352.1 right-handed parallel beta-helix repeat-containing protein [Rhodoferax sp. AJA081-3]
MLKHKLQALTPSCVAAYTGPCLVAMGCCLAPHLGAHAMDVFNPVTNLLIMDQITVAGLGMYTDVRATIHSYSLLEVDGSVPQTAAFDPATSLLTLASVKVDGKIYNNVRVKIHTHALLNAEKSGAVPTPSPSPTPTPTTAGTYYFSDCQAGSSASCVQGNNANPGTQAEPKQSLMGLNVNALPAGTQLLFNRGGVWNWTSTVRLDNRNTSAAAPLTFGAYGSGAAPVLLVSTNLGFETGEWQNTVPDGGYVFRGLKFEATASAPDNAWAIWLRGTVGDVLIEDVEFTNFGIALNGQGHDDIQRVTVRNSRFLRNKSMGVLGTFNHSLFEGNVFEGNNFSGSGFNHGTYFSNVTNLTLRNNRYLRNSVVNGICTGGNMTFHGMNDGLLIEGNTIEQDTSAPGCWLMSITQGYDTAEGFRNTVVRNNRLINGGNNAMNAQSAAGILVEGNTIINTTPTYQVAISVGHTDYPNGDLADGNATVRNNTICQGGGATGPATTVIAPNSTVSNNVVVSGVAATTGICAR